MTDRIPLDHLTSDALDALYEQLEAAEESETQRQLANAREAFASATVRAARAEKELAALRTVARGYCPACGRGDAAPTVADWEQQRRRADQAEEFSRRALEQRQEMAEERYAWQERGDRAEALVAGYEQRLTWHTTCAACARVLASSIRETERADRAEATLDQVRVLREDLHRTTGARWIAKALDHILNPEQPGPGPAATQATRTTSTDPKDTP